jgi:hypothetical protein
MTDTFKKLYQGQPGTSATTLYTVPGSTTAIVKHISIVNTASGSTHTIRLWHDGTANSNLILPVVTMASGGFATFDGTILMEASDTLSAQADAGTVLTVTVYGDEVS